MKKKVVFPEGNNNIIREAVRKLGGKIEAILLGGTANDLREACEMVAQGKAQSMIAGIDYTSRDVILTAKEIIGTKGKTFSSSFYFEFTNRKPVVVADCATCKNPTTEQLFDIIVQTYETYKNILPKIRIACLSYSTLGSGFNPKKPDESIIRIRQTVEKIRLERPDIIIDGELQLDSAINPKTAKKKAPNSPVRGNANILICPDLNSGNILYKSLEQFAHTQAYGPILQGFNAPISDLSRGSTVEDVLGVCKIIERVL